MTPFRCLESAVPLPNRPRYPSFHPKPSWCHPFSYNYPTTVFNRWSRCFKIILLPQYADRDLPRARNRSLEVDVLHLRARSHKTTLLGIHNSIWLIPALLQLYRNGVFSSGTSASVASTSNSSSERDYNVLRSTWTVRVPSVSSSTVSNVMWWVSLSYMPEVYITASDCGTSSTVRK